MGRLLVIVALVSACKGGFDPIEREGSSDGELTVDASTPSPSTDAATPPADADPFTIPCRMRIPFTDNAYLPRAQCFAELDVAREICLADPTCVLTGTYWYPGAGVNDTGACADGGGNTGCRQWSCWDRTQVPNDHVEI